MHPFICSMSDLPSCPAQLHASEDVYCARVSCQAVHPPSFARMVQRRRLTLGDGIPRMLLQAHGAARQDAIRAAEVELAAAEALAAEVAVEGVALDKQLVAAASETEVPVVRVLKSARHRSKSSCSGH